MEIINAYFKKFTYLKWLMFILLSSLVILSLEWQCERLYWQYWNFEPLIIHGKMQVLNKDKTIYPGEILLLRVDFTKNLLILPTEIRTQMFNSFVYDLTPETKFPAAAMKPLGRQQVSFPLPFPRAAEYGKYHIHRTWVYRMGPYKREVAVTAESEDFYSVAQAGGENKGPKGDTGKTGGQGVKGDKGKQGDKGDKGKTGDFTLFGK